MYAGNRELLGIAEAHNQRFLRQRRRGAPKCHVAEQVFRFNLRKKENTAAERFKAVLKDVVGRRLTYAELMGRFAPAA